MFVLIPLVNMPFDWASIGLTRALLRRGCEPNAWHPVLLGLIDIGFGLLLLIILAVALIAALQAADWITLHFHAGQVANPAGLLASIHNNPRNRANYWAYITLFSTLLPSALNAAIGAGSVVTWWFPPARRYALENLDRDPGMRARVALLIGAQMGLGTLAAGGAMLVLWELFLESETVLPTAVDAAIWFAKLLEPAI
jgi:hypothetical protein